jgi:hypothetical protein
VPGLENAGAQLLAVARTASDLLPYLALLGLGFLIAAWGQSARVRLAIVIGILMILAAAGGFVLGNDSGGPGVPGLD